MVERIGGDQATIMIVIKRLNKIFIGEELPECILQRLVSKFNIFNLTETTFEPTKGKFKKSNNWTVLEKGSIPLVPFVRAI